LKETELRMIQLLGSPGATWIDVEFLKAANEQLVKCRRVLKYTYALGFYFDHAPPEAKTIASTSKTQSSAASPGRSESVAASAGNTGHDAAETTTLARERFEHHQEMLERFTESLSESSEKPEGQMNREDIVNQTRVVDKFVTNLLKYVNETPIMQFGRS
jgi:ariadne-1